MKRKGKQKGIVRNQVRNDEVASSADSRISLLHYQLLFCSLSLSLLFLIGELGATAPAHSRRYTNDIGSHQT